MRRSSIWAIFAFAVLGWLAGAWATQGLTPPAVAAVRLAPSALPGGGGGALGTTPTATVTTTPPPAASATPTPSVICVANFQDVPTEYWAYGYIEWIFCHSLVTGYDCGTGCMEFRPEANTTRAQIAKMLTLGFNFPIVTPPTPSFADVPTGAWYYGWVESAYARNVFAGYQCGGPGEPCDPQNRPYFRPSSSVTRAQIAKIVVLSAGWPLVTPTTPTFSDVLANYWAYSFIETAYSQAVIGGYDCLLLTPNPTPQPQCREFRPGLDATRAQFSKMIYIAITPPAQRRH